MSQSIISADANLIPFFLHFQIAAAVARLDLDSVDVPFCSSSSRITSKWFFQHWWAPCLLPRRLLVCWKQAAFYYVPERQNAEQFTFQRPSQTFKSTNSFCCWFRYTKSSLGLFRANFEADDASNKLE